MTPAAIRAAREQLGLTQGRAAYLFGVQRRTWCRWEAGEWPIQRAAGVLLQLAVRDPSMLRMLEAAIGTELSEAAY